MEDRSVLYTIKRRKAIWIAHIPCRKDVLKHVIEGNTVGWIEVSGRQGRRRKHLLDGLKEKTGYSKLKRKH
jgi:hypothetical protein